MSDIHINAEILAGTHIEKAAVELQALADRVGCDVWSSHNDVRLYVIPGGSASRLVENWERAFNKKPDTHFKSAHSV